MWREDVEDMTEKEGETWSESAPAAGRAGLHSGSPIVLLLIAIAVFSAFSYSISDEDPVSESEAAKLVSGNESSAITASAAAVQQAVQQMAENKINPEEFEFNPPDRYDSLTRKIAGVFHPNGGGAKMPALPSLSKEGAPAAVWIYSADYEVEGIGTGDAGKSADGNDIVAFLVNVPASLCRQINKDLDIFPVKDVDKDGIAAANASGRLAPVPSYALNNMDSGHGGLKPDLARIGGEVASQPFGCLDTDDFDPEAPFVYYHVLLAR